MIIKQSGTRKSKNMNKSKEDCAHYTPPTWARKFFPSIPEVKNLLSVTLHNSIFDFNYFIIFYCVPLLFELFISASLLYISLFVSPFFYFHFLFSLFQYISPFFKITFTLDETKWNCANSTI